MASKQITRTLVGDGRRIEFSIADPSSGDNAGHLVCSVVLASDGGPGHAESVPFIVTGPNQNSGLTGGERSSLVALLTKLYDAAKTAAAYT